MVFCCDNCHLLFSHSAQLEQCPDCGKYRVRMATEAEQEEFKQQLDEQRRDPL